MVYSSKKKKKNYKFLYTFIVIIFKYCYTITNNFMRSIVNAEESSWSVQSSIF